MSKVMGFHDDLRLFGDYLSSLEIDAATFRRCVFTNVSLSQSSLYHVSFEKCDIQGLSLQSTSLTHVSLCDSTITKVDSQIPIKALGKLFNCVISGVHFVGARSDHLDSVVVQGGSMSGQLTRVSFVEDKKGTQLSGTDLTGAELASVRFVGIPMERMTLSDTASMFVLPDWHNHADAVSEYTNKLLQDHSLESPKYRAGFHVFHQIQQDWEQYHFAHGRNQDDKRGGRYIAEARNEKLAPPIRTEILEIYRTVTGIDFPHKTQP